MDEGQLATWARSFSQPPSPKRRLRDDLSGRYRAVRRAREVRNGKSGIPMIKGQEKLEFASTAPLEEVEEQKIDRAIRKGGLLRDIVGVERLPALRKQKKMGKRSKWVANGRCEGGPIIRHFSALGVERRRITHLASTCVSRLPAPSFGVWGPDEAKGRGCAMAMILNKGDNGATRSPFAASVNFQASMQLCAGFTMLQMRCLRVSRASLEGRPSSFKARGGTADQAMGGGRDAGSLNFKHKPAQGVFPRKSKSSPRNFSRPRQLIMHFLSRPKYLVRRVGRLRPPNLYLGPRPLLLRLRLSSVLLRAGLPAIASEQFAFDKH
ncbi:hypothetical protein C8R43DRAFT_955146 [Mycena crocata]|nr:hypothetical protein C8R43DRAFT_955146 [Mycena crocata]